MAADAAPEPGVEWSRTPHPWRFRRDRANCEGVMSKGMDQKKNQKKEPARTLKEKRAAKQEKKANR
ncbi:hypothetical protein [Xanthomonas sp. XNM01]|uniref:hypothetical protein n=1 Tax=Xanthomonas sp. XNM01 TaxID=2769289 RepID=UPI0031BBAB6C